MYVVTHWMTVMSVIWRVFLSIRLSSMRRFSTVQIDGLVTICIKGVMRIELCGLVACWPFVTGRCLAITIRVCSTKYFSMLVFLLYSCYIVLWYGMIYVMLWYMLNVMLYVVLSWCFNWSYLEVVWLKEFI